MSEDTTILFVYGTLKRGLASHHLISDQDFLGEAATDPRYRVYDLGPYPGLVVDEANGLAVKGEIWAVTAACLAELDIFEEESHTFRRALVAIPGLVGVFAYFWNRAVPEGAASGREWPLNGGHSPSTSLIV